MASLRPGRAAGAERRAPGTGARTALYGKTIGSAAGRHIVVLGSAFAVRGQSGALTRGPDEGTCERIRDAVGRTVAFLLIDSVAIVVIRRRRLRRGTAGVRGREVRSLCGVGVHVPVAAVCIARDVNAGESGRTRRCAGGRRARIDRYPGGVSVTVLVAVGIPLDACLAALAVGVRRERLGGANTGRRVACAGDVARVARRADDRVAAHAHAIRARVGLRARVPVVAPAARARRASAARAHVTRAARGAVVHPRPARAACLRLRSTAPARSWNAAAGAHPSDANVRA